jgi:hypothetical protein
LASKIQIRLDVIAKWSFDLRLIVPADPDYRPWLGLICASAGRRLNIRSEPLFPTFLGPADEIKAPF